MICKSNFISVLLFFSHIFLILEYMAHNVKKHCNICCTCNRDSQGWLKSLAELQF